MKKNISKKIINICFSLVFLSSVSIFSSCSSIMTAMGVDSEDVAEFSDTMGEIAKVTARAVGVDDIEKFDAIADASVGVVNNTAKASEGILPEVAYAIGRSAAATIIENYELYKNEDVTAYLNMICKVLTMYSPYPYLYKGYSVAVLQSDEINAISTPGGHIFITRGLLKSTTSEDAIAAVLAHEISHIQLSHSVKAIESERRMDAATSWGSLALAATTDSFSSEDVEALNESSNSFLRTALKDGYSRTQEFDADENALKLMKEAGYNPYAILEMLKGIEHNTSGLGWFDTHPKPEDRIKAVNKALEKNGYEEIDQSSRDNRYRYYKMYF